MRNGRTIPPFWTSREDSNMAIDLGGAGLRFDERVKVICPGWPGTVDTSDSDIRRQWLLK